MLLSLFGVLLELWEGEKRQFGSHFLPYLVLMHRLIAHQWLQIYDASWMCYCRKICHGYMSLRQSRSAALPGAGLAAVQECPRSWKSVCCQEADVDNILYG